MSRSDIDRWSESLQSCRICHCTRITACDVPTAYGSRACGWVASDLCDNPACVRIARHQHSWPADLVLGIREAIARVLRRAAQWLDPA